MTYELGDAGLGMPTDLNLAAFLAGETREAELAEAELAEARMLDMPQTCHVIAVARERGLVPPEVDIAESITPEALRALIDEQEDASGVAAGFLERAQSIARTVAVIELFPELRDGEIWQRMAQIAAGSDPDEEQLGWLAVLSDVTGAELLTGSAEDDAAFLAGLQEEVTPGDQALADQEKAGVVGRALRETLLAHFTEQYGLSDTLGQTVFEIVLSGQCTAQFRQNNPETRASYMITESDLPEEVIEYWIEVAAAVFAELLSR